MASEIEIETEKSKKKKKLKKMTQEVITLVPVMLTFYDSDLKTVKERSRSRLKSMHKFQRKRKYNEFSQYYYYYLFGNKGAGPFNRGSRFLTQDIQITNLQSERQKIYDTNTGSVKLGKSFFDRNLLGIKL